MPEVVVGTVRDLRRSQILAAARTLVAGEGLSALTISALEERLEFSRGVITYHFRNKEEIVHAVLQSAIEEIDAAARTRAGASLEPEAKVRATLSAMVHGFMEQREAGLILLSFWGRLGADPRAASVNAALYRRYRCDSARLLRKGIKEGRFRRVNVDAAAALLVGIVIGIVTQAYFDDGALDVEACIEEGARSLLARLSRG